MGLPDKVNLTAAFAQFSDHWSPRIAGQVNNMHVKLAKFKGELIGHFRETNEDELFLVTKGRLIMQFRGKNVSVGPGEFIIVPRGVEHCPKAETEEVEVVLLEPATTFPDGVPLTRAATNPVRRQSTVSFESSGAMPEMPPTVVEAYPDATRAESHEMVGQAAHADLVRACQGGLPVEAYSKKTKTWKAAVVVACKPKGKYTIMVEKKTFDVTADRLRVAGEDFSPRDAATDKPVSLLDGD